MFINCKHRLTKYRISFSDGTYHYDIDTYEDGESIVEVEFPSLESVLDFKKPEFVGEEITAFGATNFARAGITQDMIK
jgi:hypothetical protein